MRTRPRAMADEHGVLVALQRVQDVRHPLALPGFERVRHASLGQPDVVAALLELLFGPAVKVAVADVSAAAVPCRQPGNTVTPVL